MWTLKKILSRSLSEFLANHDKTKELIIDNKMEEKELIIHNTLNDSIWNKFIFTELIIIIKQMNGMNNDRNTYAKIWKLIQTNSSLKLIPFNHINVNINNIKNCLDKHSLFYKFYISKFLKANIFKCIEFKLLSVNKLSLFINWLLLSSNNSNDYLHIEKMESIFIHRK